jgi:hypothetical protein
MELGIADVFLREEEFYALTPEERSDQIREVEEQIEWEKQRLELLTKRDQDQTTHVLTSVNQGKNYIQPNSSLWTWTQSIEIFSANDFITQLILLASWCFSNT